MIPDRQGRGNIPFVLKSPSLLIGALALVVSAACVANSGAKQPAAPASVALVQRSSNIPRLYEDNCAKCHGAAGEGGGGGTKSLNTEEKFDQKWDKPFFDAIKHGVPDMGMEAYSTLSDPEIWALVVHIRELQAKALRAKNGSPRPQNGVYRSQHHDYRVETVVDGDQRLRTPWGIDWLPDGKMLVTNRPGGVVIVQGGKVVGSVRGVPETAEIGQGGMMEVTVHPNYAKTGWVYLGFTEPAPSGRRGGQTKIVRGKLRWEGSDAIWTDEQTIFACDPESYTTSGVHFGNRIVFDGKGHVFFSIGERGNAPLAQDLTKPNGKVFRLNEDGSVPRDNPFADPASRAKGYLPAIWSYGHRNPQGLAFDLEGNLWDTEHGPRGGDEVNLIKKGANYGWPLVSFSMNYNMTPLVTPWPKAGQQIAMPAFRWLPSIGACGLDTVRGAAFPKWKGDLMAGGLSGANVDRLRMKDGKLVEREEILHGMGRVREVATAPDGTIYVALNQPDKIVRLVPR